MHAIQCSKWPFSNFHSLREDWTSDRKLLVTDYYQSRGLVKKWVWHMYIHTYICFRHLNSHAFETWCSCSESTTCSLELRFAKHIRYNIKSCYKCWYAWGLRMCRATWTTRECWEKEGGKLFCCIKLSGPLLLSGVAACVGILSVTTYSTWCYFSKYF